jgi:hypothetical protein
VKGYISYSNGSKITNARALHSRLTVYIRYYEKLVVFQTETNEQHKSCKQINKLTMKLRIVQRPNDTDVLTAGFCLGACNAHNVTNRAPEVVKRIEDAIAFIWATTTRFLMLPEGVLASTSVANKHLSRLESVCCWCGGFRVWAEGPREKRGGIL